MAPKETSLITGKVKCWQFSFLTDCAATNFIFSIFYVGLAISSQRLITFFMNRCKRLKLSTSNWYASYDCVGSSIYILIDFPITLNPSRPVPCVCENRTTWRHPNFRSCWAISRHNAVSQVVHCSSTFLCIRMLLELHCVDKATLFKFAKDFSWNITALNRWYHC